MPPSRKMRYNNQQRSLRQLRQSSVLSARQEQDQEHQQRIQDEQSQQQHQQQQSQQQLDKQTSCQNCIAQNDNARADNKAPTRAGNDIKDAIHKDIQEMLETDLCCAICREIYINPLILNCAHSFCRYCLDNWLSKQVGCPTCRMPVVFQTENLALKNIVNRMVQTSSTLFQEERQQSLDQRSRAELSQGEGRAQPLMERRSFLPNGRVRHFCPADRMRVIRPWKGPNGATIWRTRLDVSDQVVRPEAGSDAGNPDVSDSDDDDDDYLGLGSSPIDYRDNSPDFEPATSDTSGTPTDDDDVDDDDEIDDDPEFDESADSEIDVDSDESSASSRGRRINNLRILAGIVAPDDDEDYEVEIEDVVSSSDESSMDTDDGFDAFGLFGRISDTNSEDEDSVRAAAALGHDMRNETSESSDSSTDEEEEEEEEEGDAAEEDEDLESEMESVADSTDTDVSDVWDVC